MGIGSQKLLSFLLATTALTDIVHAAAAADTFADALLTGEAEGFAIDATDVSATPAYTGAPYAGYVSVKDTGTPANNLSNVNLDSSNLVQSGTSPKMVLWNSSPYLRWTPHNLAIRSEAIGVTGWSNFQVTAASNNTTAPDGNSTADKITTTATNNFHVTETTNTITIVAGAVYTYSVYLKDSTAQYASITLTSSASGTVWVRAAADLSGGTITQSDAGAGATLISSGIVSVGSGWYRVSVTGILGSVTDVVLDVTVQNTGTPGTAAFALNTWNAAGTEAIYAWGAQLVRGYNANPYLVTTTAARIGIPQAYDTAASKYGILIEPAATNLVLTSEDVTTNWTNFNSTDSANATTAPDGSSTADKIIENAGSADHVIEQNITLSVDTYTISVFMKAAERTWGVINAYNGSNNYSYFDLSNGVTGTNAAGNTSTITAVGNGWYRCTLTRTMAAASAVDIAPASADNTIVYNGDGTSGIYFWGVQVETGSVATSYIPTLGSTVTRAADVPKALLSTFPWSDTNGSIYIKYKPRLVSSGSRYAWQAYKDANNHISLLGIAADPTLENTQASTQDVAIDAGTLVASTLTRISSAFKGNDFDVSQDAAAVVSDATATLTTLYTDLYIGTKGAATSEELNGHIYQLLYVPYQRQTVNSDLDTWKSAA